MVKHIIIWTLKEEYSEQEKTDIKRGIKEGLEGLQGKIPGLLEIRVNINPLESSNCDVMIDSTFTDAAALAGYTVHPEHVLRHHRHCRYYHCLQKQLSHPLGALYL